MYYQCDAIVLGTGDWVGFEMVINNIFRDGKDTSGVRRMVDNVQDPQK
jgi:hypothetical protein